MVEHQSQLLKWSLFSALNELALSFAEVYIDGSDAMNDSAEEFLKQYTPV